MIKVIFVGSIDRTGVLTIEDGARSTAIEILPDKAFISIAGLPERVEVKGPHIRSYLVAQLGYLEIEARHHNDNHLLNNQMTAFRSFVDDYPISA